MSDIDENDDNAGGYELEEYDVGPSHDELQAAENAQIDFRMDRPPPSASDASLERRFAMAGEEAPMGMQLARPPPGTRQGISSHTGPKGVKADYEAAKQVLRNQRLLAAGARERQLRPQQRVTIEDLQPPAQKNTQKEKQRRSGSDSDSSEDSDEDALAAFERYKQERIAFVQNSLPRFGSHTRVSKGEFARIVREVHDLVYVVCHIYQNSLESCVRLNYSLESLAPQFPHVRFCRLRSTEALPRGFSAAGLPMLLVYRGGQMVSSAMRVAQALPANFSDLDVAKLLQAKGILSVPTGLPEYGHSRLRESASRQWSDDENEEAERENEQEHSGFSLLNDLQGMGISSSSSSSSAGVNSSSRSSSSRPPASASSSAPRATATRSAFLRSGGARKRAADSDDSDDSD